MEHHLFTEFFNQINEYQVLYEIIFITLPFVNISRSYFTKAFSKNIETYETSQNIREYLNILLYIEPLTRISFEDIPLQIFAF